MPQWCHQLRSKGAKDLRHRPWSVHWVRGILWWADLWQGLPHRLYHQGRGSGGVWGGADGEVSADLGEVIAIMKKLGLCVLVGLGLSPCAGGMTTGGSPNNSVKQTVVTQYPVEAALLNIYTKPRSEKLINIDDSHFITETEVKWYLCHCYKINPKGDILASKLSIEYSSTRENSNDTKTFNFISE